MTQTLTNKPAAMSAASKKVVRSFLESNVFLKPEELSNYFSEHFVMKWHASSGYRNYDFKEYQRLCEFTSNSYTSLRASISNIISEKEDVAVRFTVYVKTIENPTEEIPIGYFISIFKVSYGKIVEINQSSHPKE
jgi:hypothetical protein